VCVCMCVYIYIYVYLFFPLPSRFHPPEKYQPSEWHDQRNSLNEVPAANRGLVYYYC